MHPRAEAFQRSAYASIKAGEYNQRDDLAPAGEASGSRAAD